MTLNNTGSNSQLPSTTEVTTTTTTGSAERPLTLPVAVTLIDDELLRSFSHTKRVGDYLLGRTIGEGSFAKVKEALHVVTGELVAVKVIDKKKAKEDPYVKRNMRRESKLLQQIRHRNIVQLFEVMETENSYYLVMEYCAGGDLLERIYARKRLDEVETRRYVRQIVSAVEYMHKVGVIHRDLKVENLLLDENKDIKIIDFGLSNSIRVDNRIAQSRPNAAVVVPVDDGRTGSDAGGGGGGLAPELCTTQCGSPAYAAPELLNNHKYGPKVDIWSIGVNMFAMLTGNLPFTVEPFTIRALHNKMMKGEMNALPDHLSKGCRDLLQRFLTPDPERRISLQLAMQHPWLAGKRPKQLDPAPFPNRLRPLDLNQSILVYMAQQLDFRLADVINLVTSNSPSGATATYFLLQRRLSRHQRQRAIDRTASIENAHITSFHLESKAMRRSPAYNRSTTTTMTINVPSTVVELHSPTTSPRTTVSPVVEDISDDHGRSTSAKQPRVSLTVASRINHTAFVSFDDGCPDAVAPKIVLDDVTDALDDVIHVDGTQRHLHGGDVIRNAYDGEDDDTANSCGDDVTMAVTYRYHGDTFEERPCDRQKAIEVGRDERDRGGKRSVECTDRKEIEIDTSINNDEDRSKPNTVDSRLESSNDGVSGRCRRRRPSTSDVNIDIDVECDNVSDKSSKNCVTSPRSVDIVPHAVTADKRPLTMTSINPGIISSLSTSVARRNVYRTIPRRRHVNSTVAAAAIAVTVLRGSGTPIRNKSITIRQPLPVDRGRNHPSVEAQRTQSHAYSRRMKAVDALPLLSADDDELTAQPDASGAVPGGWRLRGSTTAPFPNAEHSVSGRSTSFRQRPWLQAPRRQLTTYQLITPRQPVFLFAGSNEQTLVSNRSQAATDLAQPDSFKASHPVGSFRQEPLHGKSSDVSETCNVIDLKFTGDKGPSRGPQGGSVGSPTFKRQLTVTNLEPPVGALALLPPLSVRRSFEHYGPRS